MASIAVLAIHARQLICYGKDGRADVGVIE
jgi:hypothetical protein